MVWRIDILPERRPTPNARRSPPSLRAAAACAAFALPDACPGRITPVAACRDRAAAALPWRSRTAMARLLARAQSTCKSIAVATTGAAGAYKDAQCASRDHRTTSTATTRAPYTFPSHDHPSILDATDRLRMNSAHI